MLKQTVKLNPGESEDLIFGPFIPTKDGQYTASINGLIETFNVGEIIEFGILQGFALDKKIGEAIAGAKVYVNDVFYRETASNGGYSMNLLYGTYDIRVVANNYQDGEFQVVIDSDIEIMDFELERITPQEPWVACGDNGCADVDITAIYIHAGGSTTNEIIIGDSVSIYVQTAVPYPVSAGNYCFMAKVTVNGSTTLLDEERCYYHAGNPSILIEWTPPEVGSYVIQAADKSATLVVNPEPPPPPVIEDLVDRMLPRPQFADKNIPGPNHHYLNGEEEEEFVEYLRLPSSLLPQGLLQEYFVHVGATHCQYPKKDYQGPGGGVYIGVKESSCRCRCDIFSDHTYFLCRPGMEARAVVDIIDPPSSAWTAHLDVCTRVYKYKRGEPVSFYTWVSRSGIGDKIRFDNLRDPWAWLGNKPVESWYFLRIEWGNGDVWIFPGAYFYDNHAEDPATKIQEALSTYKCRCWEYNKCADLLEKYAISPPGSMSSTLLGRIKTAAQHIIDGFERGMKYVGRLHKLEFKINGVYRQINYSDISYGYNKAINEAWEDYDAVHDLWRAKEAEYEEYWR